MRVVFLHLMKCAGTSIHQALHSMFDDDDFYAERFHLGVTRGEPAEDLSPYRVFSGHFDSLDLPHFPEGSLKFTSLRDPVERALSHFNFWQSHDRDYLASAGLRGMLSATEMTALEFFNSDSPDFRNNFDNYYVRSFSGSRRDGRSLVNRPEEHLQIAIDTLSGFDHIGRTDEVDSTIDWVARQFGFDPALVTRERLNQLNSWEDNPLLHRVEPTPRTPELLEAIEKHAALDRRLMAAVGLSD